MVSCRQKLFYLYITKEKYRNIFKVSNYFFKLTIADTSVGIDTHQAKVSKIIITELVYLDTLKSNLQVVLSLHIVLAAKNPEFSF